MENCRILLYRLYFEPHFEHYQSLCLAHILLKVFHNSPSLGEEVLSIKNVCCKMNLNYFDYLSVFCL